MVRWLARNKVRPMYVVAGDSVCASVFDPINNRREEVTTQITEARVIDEIAIGEIENELGFKHAIVGVFGQS